MTRRVIVTDEQLADPNWCYDNVVALYEGGRALNELAELTRRSYSTVRRTLHQRGAAMRPPGRGMA